MVVEETPVGSRWRGVGEMPAGGPRAGRGSCTLAETYNHWRLLKNSDVQASPSSPPQYSLI